MATQTQKPVQTTLPTGAFTPQQSQASQDVLSLMQKMVSKPTLATGTAILPKAMAETPSEILGTTGVTSTVPTAAAQLAAAPTGLTPTTAPTAAGDTVQKVGVVLTADTVFVNFTGTEVLLA